ncbi:MAG: MFS transporter [Dehalococcoidia bacterium]|nr:MFS transporter [Dehalococcoidia bacterium]
MSFIDTLRQPGAGAVRAVRNPSQVFYGWWMVWAGLTIQVLVGGLIMQAFSSYAAILRAEFGWSKTMLSSAFAMTRVESGILGPFQGWAIDRFGPGRIARVGVLIMGLGFFAFSQIHSPWQFFASYFLIAVGSSLAGFMTLTVAIVNWFEKKRAMALGLMSAGFAIGGLFVPAVIFSMEHWGWRETSFGSGVLVLIVGNILVTFIRHRPEDHGFTVDGAPAKQPEPAEDGSVVETPMRRDFTAREALRTPAFWFISLGHASALLVVSAVMVHLVLHLNENQGYSLSVAGLVVAMLTAMQIVGQLGGGFLGDRISKRFIIVCCMVAHMIGLLVLAYASAFWMLIVFAVLHGTAWGARGPLMQAIRADYFGRSSFGTIMGFSSMIVMLGMTTGPIVAGIMADVTGSYELGFTILAILAGMGSVFFILATPPKQPGTPIPASRAEPHAASSTAASPAGGR